MATFELNVWHTIALAFVGGIIPSLIWLWFWLQEDKKNPEPKRVILRIFLAGGLAVIPSFLLQKLSLNYFGGIETLYFEPNWSLSMLHFIIQGIPLFATWALIEEVMKLVAAYTGGLNTKDYDEPLDAMIYMITAATGFAAFENMLFLAKTLSDTNWQFTFLLTGNLRFLGATVLHIASSAFCGGIIALAACSSRLSRISAAVIGLLTATLLHALFNFFIILNEGRDIFKVLLILWFASVVLIAFFERVKHRVCRVTFSK